MIGLVLIIGLGAVLWVLKQIVGPLIGQEARESIPDYTAAKARAAARQLPSTLAAEYEETWLAELRALENKPLSALRYAHGLRRAAKRMAADSSRPRILPVAFARMGKRLNLRYRLGGVRVVRFVMLMLLAAMEILLGAQAFLIESRPLAVYATGASVVALAVLRIVTKAGMRSSAKRRGTSDGRTRESV